MYSRPTRRRSTQQSESSFPLSSDLIVIALARRCITLCVRFPFVSCFLRVPVRTRPSSSPPALRLRSLPCLSYIFVLFSFLSTAPAARSPVVCVAPSVSIDRARALPRIVVFPRITSAPRARVHSYTQYSAFCLRCRCHVTHTNWSRALAASRLVAQDTTPPHNTLVSPRVRE